MCSYLMQKKATTARRSPEVFLGKIVLKICSKFTGEHPCRSMISIKLQSNFIEITLRHGCSSVNLLHIFRSPFYRNTYGGMLLYCARKLLLDSGLNRRLSIKKL